MVLNWFAILILVSITFFVLGKKNVRYIDAFVFFIPFNATVVFFTNGGTAVNLPFTLFFLATISYFFKKTFSTKFFIPKNQKQNIIWLFVIGLIAVASQIMPFIINGEYMVLDRYKETLYWAKEEPLYPSMQWVTQTVYFLVGLMVVFIISVTYKTNEDIKKLLKLLLLGITFMVFWGWIGDVTYFLGLPYPKLFNQIGMNESGISIFNSFPRMTSVTMEPSYFAQMLIPITPYFYWFSQKEKPIIFKKEFHSIMYFLSLITVLIAITTTGVFGFFLIIGFWLKNNLRFYSLKSKYFLVIIYIYLIVISLFFAVKYIVNISETYSGIERFKTVHFGFLYFLDYPILGLGWGVFPTHDFIINLLINFGIIGTIPFLIFMYNIFVKLRFKIDRYKESDSTLYRAALESFLLILIVSQLSGLNYHSQFFWLYIGIAISIGVLDIKKEET